MVEAPTPVSALLHAGIINLGGLLLVTTPVWRFRPSHLAVVSGCGGVVLSGGIDHATRISIVRLAWSTSAQMGLMLLEIGRATMTWRCT